MTRHIKASGLDRLVEAVEAAEAAAAARTPHPVPGGFMCPHPGCARVFSKRYNQQAHMRLHDGTRPFACDLCGKDFMWKSSLKSHAKMHAKLLAAETHYAPIVPASKTGRAISKSRGKLAKKELAIVKPSNGRQSPDSISRVDHEAATLLTLFR